MILKGYEAIEPDLQGLVMRYQELLREQARHDSNAKIKENRYIAGLILFFALLVIYLPKKAIGPGIGLFFMLFAFLLFFLAIGISIYKISKARKHARSQYRHLSIKDEIMKPMLDMMLGQTTTYQEYGSISDVCNMKSTDADSSFGRLLHSPLEDVLSARLADVEVVFGELKSFREYNQGTREISSLLMLIDFHKKFAGSVSVQTIGHDRSLLTEWKLRDREQMNDARFDARFEVRTSMAQLARYILTPVLMERLLMIRERYDCGLSLLFRDGLMLVQLDWNRNMLETHINTFIEKPVRTFTLFGRKIDVEFRSSFDNAKPQEISVPVDALRRHYHDLASVIGLVDDLQQNVRIWGK